MRIPRIFLREYKENSQMAYGQNQGDFPQKKYQGDWKCSNPKCQAAITELPFPPKPDRLNELLCLNCYREKRRALKDEQSFK